MSETDKRSPVQVALDELVAMGAVVTAGLNRDGKLLYQLRENLGKESYLRAGRSAS
jgi:hypothetical protein